MTRTCWSVSDEFFAFPIVFFEAYPHHYTPIRCCAQRLGPHYPPIYYSGGAKHENDKTLYKCIKRISDATGPQKLSSRSNKSLNFMFFIICATKNVKQICQQILPKLSSRSNESSIFTILGGSKMSLQEHSERQGDSNIFPKMRKDFTEKSTKVQSVKIFARTGTDMHIK